MNTIIKLPIVIFSSFLMLLAISVMPSLYASPALLQATTPAEDQPKPGIIMIITFENGTTKAIRSDSTNIKAVNGGYFITDSSVKTSQPLQSETVSKTIVQQLVGVSVDVRINDPLPSPQPISKGCSEGWGYYVNDPDPICEPLDKIGEGPPPDQAFCAALGCPYNPPADSEQPSAGTAINDNDGFATTPVTPTDESPIGAQPQPQPEPDTEPGPDTGEGDQNEGGEGQNDEDSSDEGSSTEGEEDDSGEGDESVEE
jgi:hypothetical protein